MAGPVDEPEAPSPTPPAKTPTWVWVVGIVVGLVVLLIVVLMLLPGEHGPARHAAAGVDQYLCHLAGQNAGMCSEIAV